MPSPRSDRNQPLVGGDWPDGRCQCANYDPVTERPTCQYKRSNPSISMSSLRSDTQTARSNFILITRPVDHAERRVRRHSLRSPTIDKWQETLHCRGMHH